MLNESVESIVMKQLLARKIEMSQMFDDLGKQIPVTVLEAEPAVINGFKTVERDGYVAVQVGYGAYRAKAVTKPVAGQSKQLSTTPRYLKEERVDTTEGLETGQAVELSQVLAVGDLISVQGQSKGKGFQGGVRRWGFGGGPKTHGQSDRHRAPGSIGAGTSPGRVLKGKRMAGHMGNRRITTQGLRVMAIEGNKIMVKGAVPGARQSLIVLTKQG
jgi:large subunit ribosomal protein L3